MSWPQWATTPSKLAVTDAVDAGLADALVLASAAREWAVVAQLARELEAPSG
jgi:hypothetical protein